MLTKLKVQYLNILRNVKENAYDNNKELLKQDLITLRNILVVYQDNENMKKLEKNMTKVLTKTK